MNQEAAAVGVLTVPLGCADHPTLCDVLDVNTLSVYHCFSHLFFSIKCHFKF